MRSKFFFILSGISLLLIFLLHILIAFMGGDYYRYFGAGEKFAQMSENGLLFPAIITTLIALVFLIMSLYAFSGAKLLKRLPFQRSVLLTNSLIFILRGLMIIPDLFFSIRNNTSIINKESSFSFVSLVIGVMLIIGTILNWRSLIKPKNNISKKEYNKLPV